MQVLISGVKEPLKVGQVYNLLHMVYTITDIKSVSEGVYLMDLKERESNR